MLSSTDPSGAWYAQLGDARLAWSITALVLAIPLFIIAWYLFKQRHRLIDRSKAWLASRPFAPSTTDPIQRQLRELSETLGQSWITRCLASRQLQGAICLSRSSTSLYHLVKASSFGFAHKSGIFSPTNEQVSDAAKGFGWAKHDNFLLLGWSQPSSDEAIQPWTTMLRLAARSSSLRNTKYLLLSIEIQDLLDLNRIDRQAQAEVWGQHLHLASEAMGRQLPVYVVVQGLEGLPGFESFCSQVPLDMAQAPWGWSLSKTDCLQTQDAELTQAHQRFSQDLMTGVLNESLLDDPGPRSKDLVYFAHAVAHLNHPLQEVLRCLLSYRFSSTPLDLRGVYFSGQQEGQGQFSGDLLEALRAASQQKPRPTPSIQRRVRRTRHLALCTLGASVLATWLLPWNAANRNRALQAQMQEVLGDLAAQRDTEVHPAIWANSLALDRSIASVRQHAPWDHRFGMSQAPLLEHGSRSLFVSLTMRWGVHPMLLQDLRRIQTLSAVPQQLSPRQARELRNRLFRYLALSKAERTPQPDLTGMVAHRLSQSLAGHWSKHYVFESEISAKEIAEHFVSHLAQRPELRLQRDLRLVQTARAKLAKSDLLASFAQDAIQQYSKHHPPLILGHTKVPAAFTQKAWNQALMPKFRNYLERYLQDAWLFGFDPQKTEHLQNNAGLWLASTYANAFESAWKTALMEIATHPEALDQRSSDELPSLYANLFRELSDQLTANLNLRPLARSVPDPIAEIPAKFSALRRFTQANASQSASLPQYLEILANLEALSETTREDRQRIKALDALLLTTSKISAAQPKAWRSFFAQILSAPIMKVKHSTNSKLRQGQSLAWCELSARLHAEVFDRYPFKKNAQKEVELAQLTALLHPDQGELWRFAKAHEGRHLEIREAQIRGIDGPAGPKIHPRLIKQLNAAWRVSQVFFPKDAAEPRLSLLVRARATRDVSTLRLQINDTSYDLSNREAMAVSWPSQGLSTLSNIFAKHANQPFSLTKRGTWALFRLIESGHHHTKESSGAFSVSWDFGPLKSAKVQLKIKAQGSPSPFYAYPRRPVFSLFRSRWLQSRPPLFGQERKCDA